MKQAILSKKILRAIVLIITIAIGLSACDINLTMPGTTPETTTLATTPELTTPEEVITTPQGTTASTPDMPVEPPVHVCVFSDWVTVKEASTTEDGLRERKCECGKVEQEVIEASNTEYYVEYRNLKSAAYPSETGYNSKNGLLNLPQPEAVGYEFVGWYTASIGGDLVDYIPKGSKQDYILFARWKLVTYTITYKNAPNNINITSYNIEDKLKLENPKWPDMIFTHWSDSNGNIFIPDINITSLPEKMTGDLTLTANWKTLENIVTPAPLGSELYTAFSGEDGFLYFFYDLGTIEHVVLDTMGSNLYYKAEGMPISLTLSKTVTISEEKAQSISNTVSKSISSTDTWSHTTNWAETTTDYWNNKVGGSIEGEVGSGPLSKKVLDWSVKVKVEASGDWGYEDAETNGWTHSNSGSSSESESNTDTIGSSIAYKNEITSEITENFSIGADLPSGYYAYVHAGNIRVIAVVSYEISTGCLYLNTYSRLDNMHSMMMYYADVNQMNNPTVEGLDFTIPEEEIINIVENSYYVKYDANGGTGTMPSTIHAVDKNSQLAKNQFTREGYTFAGWELKTGSSVKVLQDGESILNLGSSLQTVTLKAMWSQKDYTCKVEYKSTNGTLLGSENITHEYGKTVQIHAKNFDGYDTPESKYILFDSSTKVITFIYSPTTVSVQTLKSNEVWWKYNNNTWIKYTLTAKCVNRTEDSVTIEITWTNKINKAYYAAEQWFNMTVGGKSTGKTVIASSSKWGSQKDYYDSATKTVTITITGLSATTTSLPFSVVTGAGSGFDHPANFSGTIKIPAY